MRTSDAINELAAALSKAQGAVMGAKKDAKNDHFKSRYADLASVWEACRKPLADNGLAVVQGVDDPRRVMVTRLTHSSGQWVESDTPIYISDKATMQQVGSALTYARRYSLMAIVGIAPEDDDGNAAAEAPAERARPTNQKQAAKEAQAPAGPDVALMLRKLSSCTDMAELVAMWKDAAFQADFKRASEADQARLNAKKEEAKAVLSEAIFDRPGEAA